MKRKIKIIILGSLLLLVALAGIFVFLYSYTPVVDQAILKVVNSALGENVKIEYDRIEGNLFGSIRLINVKIITPGLLATAKKITVSHNSQDFLDGITRIKLLLIDSPEIFFEKSTELAPAKAEPPATLEPESLEVSIDLYNIPI